MSKLKTGKFSRVLKLGTSLTKAASNYAIGEIQEKVSAKAQQVKDATEKAQATAKQIKAAQEIIKSMGELKGAVMKIGQMLSITEDMVLPPEITQLFKKLQKDAPPMAITDIDKVFMKDFGKKPSEIFETFDYNQLASASIGQVHLATLPTGEKVAVKIQYPDIDKAITNDLSNLDNLDRLITLLVPKKPEIRHFLEEMRDNLIKECDYLNEMKNMEEFREIFKDEFPNIIIPKVYADFSTTHILTTEFMEGDHFDETVHYSQEVKDTLGETLYNSFLFALFQRGALHTDPQEGNFLFQQEKIIMMDFGSIRHFDEKFRKSYAKYCYAVEKEDMEQYRQACLELNLADENTKDEYLQRHFNLARTVYVGFLKPGKYPIGKINPIGYFPGLRKPT